MATKLDSFNVVYASANMYRIEKDIILMLESASGRTALQDLVPALRDLKCPKIANFINLAAEHDVIAAIKLQADELTAFITIWKMLFH